VNTTRSVLCALAATACAGGASPSSIAKPTLPAVVRYAPHRAAYVALSKGRQEQLVPGGSTTAKFGFRVYLNTVIDEDPGGLRITIRVDSVPEASGAGIPPSDLPLASGTTITGYVAENGKLSDLTGGDTTITLVRQLRRAFEEFLPPIPELGAAPGAAWIDTAVSNTQDAGMEIEIVSVAAHEVFGWTTYADLDALHITTRAEYTLSGHGSQMGQAINIDGTGVREEHSYLGADGTYLGGWAADSSNMSALVSSMGLAFPIIQVRKDSLIYRPR
jgi:hypothetical protein